MARILKVVLLALFVFSGQASHGIHNHEHGDSHEHGHNHEHGDSHEHGYNHEHGDSHEHGHNHEHGDSHEHGHNHEHGDSHEHGHNHEHGDSHEHGHNHEHGDSHEHGHNHEHGDSHESIAEVNAVLVDACTDNPCQNNGSCTVSDSGEAQCECFEGFTGPLCAYDCSAEVTCAEELTEVMVSGRKRCYYISPETSNSWWDAETACSDQGLILWEPTCNEEISAVAAVLDTTNYWIGVTDEAEEGTIVYNSTGAPFTLPTEYNSEDSDCLQYRQTKNNLEFNGCNSYTRRYVCEKQDPCA